MLVHYPYNIELVSIAHHIADQTRRAGYGMRHGKTIVDADRSLHHHAQGAGRIGEPCFLLKQFYRPGAMVARVLILECLIDKILLKAREIMVEGGERGGSRRFGVKSLRAGDLTGVHQHMAGMFKLDQERARVRLRLPDPACGIVLKPAQVAFKLLCEALCATGAPGVG